MKIERIRARHCFPGSITVPLFLMLSGALLLMSNFGLVRVNEPWQLWPLLLVAIGLEQMVLHARDRRG